MKKSALTNNWLKNLKNFIFFLILQKHINPKENFFQPIGYPDDPKAVGKS